MTIGGYEFGGSSGASISGGLLADQPDAGGDGSMYIATDQGATYLSISGAWVRVSEPAGRIGMSLKATANTGYILLQGQSWPATTGIYADLYAALGGGAGAYAAVLPDFRDRTPVGKGSGTFATLGAAVGAETHAITTPELPAHTHTLSGTPGISGSPSLSGSPSISGSPTVTGAPGIGSLAISGAPGAGSLGVASHTHSGVPGTALATGGLGTDRDTVSGSTSTGSAAPAITGAPSAGTLAVTGAPAIGSLAATVGSLAVAVGSLAVGVGSLSVSIGSLAAATTGTGTAMSLVQQGRVVQFEAKL